LLFTK